MATRKHMFQWFQCLTPCWSAQCGNLLFDDSPHESCCPQCYCLVCDAPARCGEWGDGCGDEDHCNAVDTDPVWRQRIAEAKAARQAAPAAPGGGAGLEAAAAGQLPNEVIRLPSAPRSGDPRPERRKV